MDFKDIIRAEVTLGKVPDTYRFPWPPKPWRVEIPLHARIDYVFPEPDGEPPLADGMQRVIDRCHIIAVSTTAEGPRVMLAIEQWHDEVYQGEGSVER